MANHHGHRCADFFNQIAVNGAAQGEWKYIRQPPPQRISDRIPFLVTDENMRCNEKNPAKAETLKVKAGAEVCPRFSSLNGAMSSRRNNHQLTSYNSLPGPSLSAVRFTTPALHWYIYSKSQPASKLPTTISRETRKGGLKFTKKSQLKELREEQVCYSFPFSRSGFTTTNIIFIVIVL